MPFCDDTRINSLISHQFGSSSPNLGYSGIRSDDRDTVSRFFILSSSMRGKALLAFALCDRLLGAKCTYASHFQYHQHSYFRRFCGRNTAIRTMQEAYEDAVSRLTSADIPDPESSARYMLCDVLGIGYRLVVLLLPFV